MKLHVFVPKHKGNIFYEHLKAKYHLLSDVILRLRNNITIMYFDCYFGSKFKLF